MANTINIISKATAKIALTSLHLFLFVSILIGIIAFRVARWVWWIPLRAGRAICQPQMNA